MRFFYEYLEQNTEQLRISSYLEQKSGLSDFLQSIKSFGQEQQVHNTINKLDSDMMQSLRPELSSKGYDLIMLQNDDFAKNILMYEFIINKAKIKNIDENAINIILPRLSDLKRTTINERRMLQYFLLEKGYFEGLYTTPNAYEICDGIIGSKTKQAFQKYLLTKNEVHLSSTAKLQYNDTKEFVNSKKYLHFLNQLEDNYRLPKNFLYAIMMVESGGRVIKDNINKGLFQINRSVRQKEISIRDSLDPVKSAQRVSQKLTTEFNIFKKTPLTYLDLVDVLAAYNQGSTKTRNNGSLLTTANKINIQSFEKLNTITFNHILRVFTILGEMNNIDYLSQLGIANTSSRKIQQGIVSAKGKLNETYQGKSLAQILQGIGSTIT